MAFLEVSGVVKSYQAVRGHLEVLHGVDLAVDRDDDAPVLVEGAVRQHQLQAVGDPLAAGQNAGVTPPPTGTDGTGRR